MTTRHTSFWRHFGQRHGNGRSFARSWSGVLSASDIEGDSFRPSEPHLSRHQHLAGLAIPLGELALAQWPCVAMGTTIGPPPAPTVAGQHRAKSFGPVTPPGPPYRRNFTSPATSTASA